ncbi:MAG: CAP domain-containing protein, partial [Firmicutes bacterium]|nr:CAP domain-containing protein [Bacillota bacterium]
VARIKSEDMRTNNYFSHTSPTYGSPFQMMKDFGITYRSAAENIAKTSSVDRAHTGFMNSEGHRKNILTPGFTHIGVGISGNYYTEMFISK